MAEEEYDFIVVGGGTAGLVVASRLSEDPETSVLVIEAGEDLPNLGNPGWDYSNFAASMVKAYTLSQSPWATDGHGPLQISIPEDEGGWPSVWKDTIAALGYSISVDPFSGQYYGAVMSAESVQPKSKQRSFVGSAYLQSALPRTNLTIWTKTLVDKVVFNTAGPNKEDGILATGIQYTTDGETRIVHARKEVILSGGTFHSPKILELSGIGDANLLQLLGVDVVIDNPYIGENLQSHPYYTMTFEVKDQENFQTMNGLTRQEPSAISAATEKYQQQQSGPFTKSSLNATAQLPLSDFMTAGADGDGELDHAFKEACEHVELGKTTAAFAKAHESFVRSVLSSPTEASALYYSFPGFVMLEGEGDMAPIPPGSKNYHITSASPTSPGLAVDPKLLSHPFDVEILARHVQQLEKIFKTEPLASHLTAGKRLPLVNNLSDLNEARTLVREKAISAHHHSGTCPMMPRELGGVVDEKLKVYGCKNLRVCDFSIAPLMVRWNPQATVYGIAEHGVQIIKSSY
ncbi:putative GMC oxidoreductase [Hypoxylon sp. FL0890]|nr:putative GMC oxidoreductase [Hypoxylon sp. FL0890]